MSKEVVSIFKKRRMSWQAQNLKYLRYVFNDHFVLVLMFLVGFLAYQYADFLRKMPDHWFPGYLIAAVISVMLLCIGKLATFVEAADRQFLLAKESEVQDYLKTSIKTSMVIPSVIIVLSVVVLAPLVRLPLPMLLLWLLSLLVIKYALLLKKYSTFISHQLIQWEAVISYENNRKNTILKIFSQFTEVKGLHQTAKRRKYLDGLLYRAKDAYTYLFIRTFLRSGDYFMLTLRLTGLALLSLVVIDNDLFGFLLALLFNYLLVFQLLPIIHSQDYQLLARLYPIKSPVKITAASSIVTRLLVLVSGIELLISLVSFHSKQMALLFVLSGLLLGVGYPKLKFKQK